MLFKRWQLPISTVSEANVTEHWTKASKRHRMQRKWIRLNFRSDPPDFGLPCQIKLIRVASRDLDADDNLRMAFKYIKDAIADCLIPGKAPGQADSDPRIEWEYGQEKGPMGVIIEFRKKDCEQFHI